LVISYDEYLMKPKEVTTQFGNAEFVYDGSTVLVNINNLNIKSSDELLATIDFEVSDSANGDYNISIASDVAISTETKLKVIPKVSLGSAEIYADEILIEDNLVTVPVCIRGNNGLMGYRINVDFDSTTLNLSSVLCGDEYKSGMFNYYKKDSSISLVWHNTENLSTDGTLFTLIFERVEYADFSTVVNLSYVQEDTFDENWNDVVFNCQSITIDTNVSKITGDVNSDKLLNLKDVVILKRYLAGGYDESIVRKNADINNDLNVNIVDIMILERYLDGSFEEVKQWFR